MRRAGDGGAPDTAPWAAWSGKTGQVGKEEQANSHVGSSPGLRVPAPAVVVGDQKGVRPQEDSRQADAEHALLRLERLLDSWTPSNPPRKVPAPARTGEVAARRLAGVEPQAARLAQAIAEARPHRRFLPAALLAVAAATAVAAVFALNGAPGLMRRSPSIAPPDPPTPAPHQSDGSVAGSAAAVSPLLKEDAHAARVERAVSGAPPGSPNGTASFDKVPPASAAAAAGPAANASSSADAREPPSSEAPPQPQALNPISDRTASPPSEGAPITMPASFAATAVALPAVEAVRAPAEPEPKSSEGAPNATSASSAATTEPLPAVEAVKASAEPEPKAADEASLGARRSEPEPRATQSDNPSGVGEAAKSKAITLEHVPLPPIRPSSLGKRAKHEKAAKPHKEAKAAAEPSAPAPAAQPDTSAARPDTPIAQPADNPLLRLFGDAFK